MRTADFDYELPPELIAQTPIEPRDSSRLLVVHRKSGAFEHRVFRDLGDYLRPGDLLVCNDSRVIPARLHGRKPTGGRVEVLLLARRDERIWQALMRGKGLRPGARVYIEDAEGSEVAVATIVAEEADGARTIEFDRPITPLLPQVGEVPLPPYIHEPLRDPERYQTVYARVAGSVAAPTAGLHFTPELIARLQAMGVGFAFVTLHVGLGTFRPVQAEEVEAHQMHAEWAMLSAEVAEQIRATRSAGGRCVAVGTTVVRVLETAALRGELAPFSGWTDLFITPGFSFQVVDAMITNFHLPRSTLLMLVSAFAGRELILRAYQEAIRLRYRFYSFGDAMLLL
ncbi:MAG: tRNA preQ1(34) S-adenosylmethionine ribosyltransferase-isomerase QueA [Anaerolineae bacterium]|nr:tRNA preQ1(34) S-adenosylmethionine ribosyltransferase-isomerase QueA [Anaerolineae bacterium]MDW8098469.1 tRNA preQ1(34) S-adenosylmethionine ribosyltransferase-isomerase QueA [Anaerolineae bacterium]